MRELKITAQRALQVPLSRGEARGIDTTDAVDRFGLEIACRRGDTSETITSYLTFLPQGVADKGIRAQGYEEKMIAKFLCPSLGEVSVASWAELIKQKRDARLVQRLRSLYPEITGIRVLPESAIYVDIGRSQLVPVHFLGDGMQRLLSLLAAVYECSHGVLLVDALDSGFHYSFMLVLWQELQAMAQDCGTQIFATTHSYDLINALCRASLRGEADAELGAFSLLHQADGEFAAVRYSFEQLA